MTDLFKGLEFLATDLADLPDNGWPRDGQEFDLTVNALDDGDTVLLELADPPTGVDIVVSELGGRYMDSDLFTGFLPDSVGTWKVRVKFHSQPHTDWESGHREDDYGFEILSKEKL